MTSGLFLQMVSADHDGVGDVDNLDLGDDFWQTMSTDGTR